MKFVVIVSSLAFLLSVSSADAQKPELVLETGHVGTIRSLSFSPDGRTLASGTPHEGTVRVWDAASGSELRSIAGKTQGVHSVVFSQEVSKWNHVFDMPPRRSTHVRSFHIGG